MTILLLLSCDYLVVVCKLMFTIFSNLLQVMADNVIDVVVVVNVVVWL